MSPDEINDLQAYSAQLTAAEQSPWEPRCVARAFATPSAGEIVFTMQHWIDLELIQSPILVGVPEEFEDAKKAMVVMGMRADELTAQGALDAAEKVVAQIAEAFGMGIPMRLEGATVDSQPDGFGAWLPLYAFLRKDCHCSPKEAMAEPVGRAFALFAAARRDEGWKPAGALYTQREVA